MDETAVYFEDNRTQTVDLVGRKHVVMKSTGFSSMRITAVMSVLADGRKASPLIIHKGKNSNTIKREYGIYSINQDRAWVNQELIISWIDLMFPFFDLSSGKCIIMDSCRAHISDKVKKHCNKRAIKLIIIPGGLIPYLQAGDIGIFREFKDIVSRLINEWKHSDTIEYTRGGNPKSPSHQLVSSWVSLGWNELSISNVRNSIKSAGISTNYQDWHIAKHDIYGNLFREKFLSSAIDIPNRNIISDDIVTDDIEDDVFELVDD